MFLIKKNRIYWNQTLNLLLPSKKLEAASTFPAIQNEKNCILSWNASDLYTVMLSLQWQMQFILPIWGKTDR